MVLWVFVAAALAPAGAAFFLNRGVSLPVGW